MRNRLLRSIARLSFKRHRIHLEHQRYSINAVSDAISVLTDRKSLLSEDSLLERVIVAALGRLPEPLLEPTPEERLEPQNNRTLD